MKGKSSAAFLAFAVAATLLFTGTSQSARTEQSQSKKDPVQAAALAKLGAFEHPTAYPDSPFRAAPYKPGVGKAAVLVQGFGAAPSLQAGKWSVEALHAMGWKSGPPVDGQFSQNTQAAFVGRAVQQKLDGIILVGVDINTIKSAINRAAAAGIPITCIVCSSGAQWKGKVYDITPDWTKAGVVAATRMLANSGSNLRALMFHDKEFSAVRLRNAGVLSTIKKDCPKCAKVTVVNMTASDFSKPGPPQWSAYLASHPARPDSPNNVMGLYDDQSIIVSKTAAQFGRKFLIGGYDGSIGNLTAMVKGTPAIDFSVAHPFEYEAWVAADVISRIHAGQPAPKGVDDMPNVLVIKANAQQLLKRSPPFPSPAGDWKGAFKKVWGK